MIGLTRKISSLGLLIISLQLILAENAKSQDMELSPVIGYATASGFPRDNNYMSIGNGFEYGISLNHALGHSWRLEFSFGSLRSDISIVSAHGYREKYCDLISNFYSIGAEKEFNHGQKLNPFVIIGGGLVHFNPLSKDKFHDYSSENLLHFSVAGGVKLRITSFLDLKFQARLLTPLWFKDEYFSMEYFGSIASFNTLKISLEGDFSAGIILIIPNNSGRK
jgi:hypothetical protein